jgi:DNA-binding response OmpR family regulator
MLVEDDRPLASGLKKALMSQGFTVNHVETGKAALHVLATDPPDLVVLDIGLPDLSGLDVLKTLRRQGLMVPVILLSARDSVDDKVVGLDMGADDYLAKPFDMTELVARLRVIERRLNKLQSNRITIGAISLDTAEQRLWVNNEEVELPRREYMLLKNLMENAGRVQTRGVLESRLYSWGEEVASNALEVHVHHLRKKLGTDFIRTIRGVGYKVAAQ